METLVVIVLWLVGVQVTLARPAQIILIRHAEKPLDASNVHLSAEGEARARALVGLLSTTPSLVTNGLPVALFAPQMTPHGHGRRPYETLEPLAEHLKLRVYTPYPAEGYAALAKRLLREPAFDGKTVVICWVHTFLPELAGALGVKPQPQPWPGSVYDRVWLISNRGRKVSLASLPQHLLPNDSPR